jgi:hypothetical protein
VVVNALVPVATLSMWWCSTTLLMHVMLWRRRLPPWRDQPQWSWIWRLTRALGRGWWWVYTAGVAATVVVLAWQAAAGVPPPSASVAALAGLWAAMAAVWPYVSKREREGTA